MWTAITFVTAVTVKPAPQFQVHPNNPAYDADVRLNVLHTIQKGVFYFQHVIGFDFVRHMLLHLGYKERMGFCRPILPTPTTARSIMLQLSPRRALCYSSHTEEHYATAHAPNSIMLQLSK